MIGTTLSHFKITAKLGEGGMGEVYRAEDTKLGREVAIKVLPEAVANDPERLARFEREAKVLASLNHPHIAAIYSIESAVPAGLSGAPGAPQDQVEATLREPAKDQKARDAALDKPTGVQTVRDEGESSRAQPRPPIPAERGDSPSRPMHFLVMELVDGATLQELIEQGVPLEQALEMAGQVAEALEEAHERGIVHRDLKPANIKIAPNGKVKVLDFGLAKALDPTTSREGASPSAAALSLSPTLTAQMTQAGVLLGTAAYMAPEQARGQQIDKRADIWAFGCVLYEMLGGRRLFDGPSVTDVLAAVIRADIDLDQLPSGVPRSIRQLLARCLDRDPGTRLRDIGEARIALARCENEESAEATPAATESARQAPRWLPWALAAAALAAGLAIGALGPWRATPATESVRLPPRQLVLPIPDRALGETPRSAPLGQAISPDGRWVAYIATDSLWVRNLSELEPRQVPESAGARGVFWSPRSDAVAFATSDRLYTFALDSSRPVELCRFSSGDFTGGSWSASQGIVFSLSRANWDGDVLRVPEDGGEPEVFTVADREKNERRLHQPHFLPDGRALLFTLITPGVNSGEIAVDRDGVRTQLGLGNGSTQPTYSPTGHVVFTRAAGADNSLWAVPFSLETYTSTGEPFRIADSGSSATVADDGTLLFELRHPEPQQLVWVDRQGRLLGPIGDPMQAEIWTPAVSHDGSRIAANIDWSYVSVWDVGRSGQVRITPEGLAAGYPAWRPGDAEIAHMMLGGEEGLMLRRADGSGAGRFLVEQPGVAFPGFSADGAWLSYYIVDPETGRDLWALALDRTEEPFVVLRTSANEAVPTISPDSSLIAYQSDASGRWEVYVQPFPEGEGRWQVSVDGGQAPRWNPRGGELFFVAGDDLMMATVSVEPEVRFGRPQRLFNARELGTRLSLPRYIENLYDVAPDGERFVLVQGVRAGTSEVVLATGLLAPSD